ncbi:MAG: bifunctional phosphopantothenoylcysteine decarboxylase/phosphopantothenate synthase [Caulobacterales bacterium 68-7]|mgnify:CR=1 FL=1|nr:bifunctional phosphopantothenoylcysteine decarboxylase/phosphopantothenate--cysteine ligase CoaBC [Caulobacterales bacterium]OJU11678.1 MAG: bifunctional phosphopantothenoylcysteine decarboxylase/phosphopantothenate synthase [Caulobacterales bacterium 68-7]
MSAAGRSVLLIVGGGIAAYKSLELVRLLRKAGIGVTAVLTKAGAEFVTPMSLSVLTGETVRQDLFSQADEAEIDHISLSRAADLVVVAPATADLMAKAAHGHANDLASTVLLATDKRVLMAPAMNVRMWEHAAVRRNQAQLEADGVAFVGPDEGEMACGEYGPGRMAEPAAIFEAIQGLLDGASSTPAILPPPAARPMAGKRVLVTAGPTHEPIDPVRYIANRSSGRQGYAVAEALAALGAEVTLVSGPVDLPAPAGVNLQKVETASQMRQACESALPVDAAVMVAAVADWRPRETANTKLKKAAGFGATLELVENPDILRAVAAKGPKRPKLVVGFAAETDALLANARAKLASKGCDWIVANDVSQPGVMGGAENTVTLVTPRGAETWPQASKTEVARKLAERIAAAL